MAQPAVRVEPMRLVHIADLVRLHQLCYPAQFATRLGSGVLTVLYRSCCEDPNVIGLVSLADERVVAAVWGVIGGGFKGRIVRRHGLALAWHLGGGLARDPDLFPEIAGRVVSLWRQDRSGMSAIHPHRFVWRSQTVHPDWRGRGTIFPLITALLDTLRQRGVDEVYSTPDEDNQAAHWIHRVLKFEKRGTQVASHGKRQSVFVLPLAPDSPQNGSDDGPHDR